MDLSRVIAISGKPGLYRLVSQTRGGFVVEDLEKGIVTMQFVVDSMKERLKNE